MNSFSERLRAYRTEKGLSQVALARTLNMSESIIRKWEAGGSDISALALDKLSAVTGKSAEWWRGETESYEIRDAALACTTTSNDGLVGLLAVQQQHFGSLLALAEAQRRDTAAQNERQAELRHQELALMEAQQRISLFKPAQMARFELEPTGHQTTGQIEAFSGRP